MKGTVIENRNSRSAVLCENGSIITVKGMFPVGKRISVPEHSFSWKKLILTMAVFLLAAALEFRYCADTVLAYGYITVNSASSIELTLNKKGNVISVQANDESSLETAAQLRAQLIDTSAAEAVSFITEDEEAEVLVSSNDENYSRAVSGEIQKRSSEKLHVHSSNIEEYNDRKSRPVKPEGEFPGPSGDPSDNRPFEDMKEPHDDPGSF